MLSTAFQWWRLAQGPASRGDWYACSSSRWHRALLALRDQREMLEAPPPCRDTTVPAHGVECRGMAHGAVGPDHETVAAGEGAACHGRQSAAAVMVCVQPGIPLVCGNGRVHFAGAATTAATTAAAKADFDKHQLVHIGLSSSRCGDMGVSVWGVYLLAAQ